jgi:hypothetical protein
MALSSAYLYTDKGGEHALLEQLLDAYQDVFAELEGLPLARACDHWIHLKAGTEPMAVRPYHYPQL